MTVRTPDALLADLNAAQREAVETTRGPLCILAGAGTGKTRVISRRIAYAVAAGAVEARHVLVVTFTDKAAGEIRERLAALGCRSIAAFTFHAAALRQLRHFWPRVSDRELPEVLESKVPIVIPLQRSLPGGYQFVSARDIAQEIEWAKARRVTPADYAFAAAADDHAGPLPPDLFAGLFGRYERAKQRAGRIDFEDMLAMTASILEDHPDAAAQVRDRYHWFSVDEYQDTNALQQLLLERWLGDRTDLAVVGDADQTIYAFTGASSAHLLGFVERFPGAKVVRIQENYRSTPQVLELANRLLAGAGSGKAEKRLVATRTSGPEPILRPFVSSNAEIVGIAARVSELLAEGVPAGEIAVLVRTNAQLPDFEQAFAQAGISYQVRGERFFDRWEVRQAIRVARDLKPARDGQSRSLGDRLEALWRRELGFQPDAETGNEQARQRQAAMSTLLVSVRDLEARDPLVDVGDFLTEVERRAADEAAGTSGGVNLLTYHRAKGLEWEAVFLPAVEEGLLPIRQASGPDAIDEERRLLYVGITRARRHLWISWAGRREGPSGKETSRRRSRFLDEVLPRPVPSARPRAGRTLAASGIGIGAGARPLSEVMPPPPKAPTDRSPTSVALRAWRLERARTDGVAAFVILHDSTLELIAERQPRSLAELRRIPGIGPQKLDRYGAEIIDAIERAT